MMLTLLRRVSLFGGFQSPSNPGLQQSGILKEWNHFIPNHAIQVVLADRGAPTDGVLQVAPGIRAETAVVVQLVFGSPSRTPVQPISAMLTDQYALQQARLDGPAPRELFVGLQPLLCQCEIHFADDWRNADLDPLLPRSLQIGAAPIAVAAALAQRPRDSLSRLALGFSKTRFANIGRIA